MDTPPHTNGNGAPPLPLVPDILRDNGTTTPWLTRHLTAIIVILLTGVVCYLAVRGDRDAIVALMGSYATLIGVQFGSRVALKIPGKDS